MQVIKPAIGILGGTFDPIHHGHLRMAQELGEAFQLHKVHLIPSYEPPHREPPMASAVRRMTMLESAISGNSLLFADNREIRRQGPSYTILSLRELRQEMPTTPLCLLIGMDAFLGLPTWHHFDEILTLAHIIVAERPTYSLPKTGVLANLMNTHLQRETSYIHAHLAGGIVLHPITALAISASEIRKQFAMGRNPRYLLPDSVYNDIQQNGTYNT